MNQWIRYALGAILLGGALLIVYLAVRPGVATPGEDAVATPSATTAGDDEYTAARIRLVESGVIDLGIRDEAVIDAMLDVPRHRFVPDEFQNQAYANHPLPIGYGQTISQP